MSTPSSSRGEFWQILAAALLVPRGAARFKALRDFLADDLGQLAAELGLDLGDAIARLSAAGRRFGDEEQLLVAYSRLFLTPVIPCQLTLGWHLDGGLAGPSGKALCELMASHGVGRSEGGYESADHLPTVLEFIALLFHRLDASVEPSEREVPERDLAILRTHYLVAPLSRMVKLAAQGENEYALPPLYSCLLSIIADALDDPLERFFPAFDTGGKKARPRYFAKRGHAAELIRCGSCGQQIATRHELRVIIDRLHRAGLPTDHLTLCPDCRDAGLGWKSGTPMAENPT